jgi:hypothetical protein
MWTNGESMENWFFTLKDVAAGDIVMVKTNAGKYTPAGIPGTSAEAMSELSEQMFDALRTERIDQFIFDNPEWLSRDDGGPPASQSPRPRPGS